MKVTINGQTLEVKSETFSTIGEPWCEYQLEGGKTVRIKFVLTHLFDTGQRDPNGNVIYSFLGTPVLALHD